MKGTVALPILVVGAVAAGGLLHLGKQRSARPASTASDPAGDIRPFVEKETGLSFQSAPSILRISDGDLRPVIGASLDERFGPDGLAHRSRAYDLLQLLPPGQNLRGLLIAAHGAGARAWFDDRTGLIHTIAGFDPSRPDDRATLVRLHARQLLSRKHPPPARHPGDDAWITRSAIHGGIAAGVHARFIGTTGAGNALPTAEETEREAILLSLPVYLHNLVQVGGMQGRDFVEARRTDGSSPWQGILDHPPARSLDLLATEVPSTPPPALPETPGTTVFEESLGAYATMLLLERLSDYLLAEGVAPAWRGDHYRLFATGTGDHLVWICRWTDPEAARSAGDIIRNTLSTSPADPAYGTERRHTRLFTTGATTLFLNCADPRTLDAITNKQ
jgi:hypothetical protein